MTENKQCFLPPLVLLADGTASGPGGPLLPTAPRTTCFATCGSTRRLAAAHHGPCCLARCVRPASACVSCAVSLIPPAALCPAPGARPPQRTPCPCTPAPDARGCSRHPVCAWHCAALPPPLSRTWMLTTSLRPDLSYAALHLRFTPLLPCAVCATSLAIATGMCWLPWHLCVRVAFCLRAQGSCKLGSCLRSPLLHMRATQVVTQDNTRCACSPS